MTPWDKDAAGGAQAAGDAGRPPVIAFVGHSGSGKTTLLLRVVPELQARGARVTVIKHS
ncbi:MAG: molybdopterin-guanine dinucleotide biosynthesis protein MobB, partial [Anaerolineae bacterium]|nr:molybdopterin-guanine dinucleotide biosynthesis protein MobB [Anaerolineae bacterium]